MRKILEWTMASVAIPCVVLIAVAGASAWQGNSQASDTKPAVEWENLKSGDRAAADQVWQRFLTSCPNVKRYADDIASVTGSPVSMPYGSFLEDKYGWPEFVEFDVVVKDSPRYIPNAWRTAGQHLTYRVGGGRAPGIDGIKPQGRRLCDGQTPTDPTSNWHKADSQMRVADRL